MRISTIPTSILLALAVGCGSVSSGDDDDSADAFVDLRPVITAVSPANGPAGGGITLTLTGSGFDAGAAHVVVGDRVAVDTSVVSDTEISFVLPPGPPEQSQTITVFNDNGFAHLLQAFTYNRIPTVAAVTPQDGPGAGGTTITITGTDFAAGPATVFVNGVEATSVIIVSDTIITAVTPALGAEACAFVWRDVVIENANGMAVLPESFRYRRPGLLIGRQSNWFEDDDEVERTMLYYIDLIANTRVPLFTVNYGIKALDVHPDGTLYGLTNRRNERGLRMLVTIDPLTEQVTEIGETLMADASLCQIQSDLGINGTTLYAIRYFYDTASHKQLVTINPATGVCTPVSTSQDFVGWQQPMGLAVKDASTFYQVSYLQGAISQLTTSGTATGTAVTIDGAPVNYRTGGMTFNAGALWAIAAKAQEGFLLRINPATGVATVVDVPVPYYAKGLSRTPPSME